MEPFFFFSYAHVDRRLCNGTLRYDGRRLNFLDDLFDDLSERVSSEVARPLNEVGYRDREGLAIGDRWSGELGERLRISRVLVAVVTPHFLNDPNDNCGREFGVFVERYKLLCQSTLTPGPHRILPIFWENVDSCWLHATPSTKSFLNKMQYSQANLPDDYPQIGLHQLRRTRPPNDYDTFIFAVGHRIVELANLPPLPPLPGEVAFDELRSAFRATDEDQAVIKRVHTVHKFSDLKLPQPVASAGRLPELQSPSGALP
jgi:hypothetical protein